MKETVDLIIHSATQLCTIPMENNGPQRGAQLGNLGIIPNGAVAINDGKIVATGTTSEINAQYEATETVDASNRVVLPGFVDPHTHIPWAGDRAQEFEARIAGKSYMEIMNEGGGIMSTVRQTRDASLATLVLENRARLDRMLRHGTTTAEAKTGYGLELQAEMKQLDAIQRLNEQQPIELTPTFLPAHAVPTEYKGRTDYYVDLLIDTMLPQAAEWQHTHQCTLFCDVFCEEGVFDLAQTKRILLAAKELGFSLKLHADEFVGLGGTKLAVELGAISADHLVATPDEDIAALGSGNTIAVGLPGTPFGLGHKQFTPAKKILAAGGALALATDCNPGTCWCESQQFIISLACRYMGLTPAQAIAAATINSAFAIDRGSEIGSLEVGKQADLIFLNIKSYPELGYRFGTNLVTHTFKRGKLVMENFSN